MNLNLTAGSSPLISRQNPTIYLVLLLAIILISIFALICFFLLLQKKKTENPEWIEQEKQRQTKYNDIKRLSKMYLLTTEEQELLWFICKKYSVSNIFYSIKKFNELDPIFKQAYNDLKMEGDEIKTNKLFLLKFKLDKYFAESLNLTSTTALFIKTKLSMILKNTNKINCTLEENTKDYFAVSIPKEIMNSQLKPDPLTKVAFTFISSTGMPYAFLTRIIRYEKRNNIELLILAHSSDLIKKTQRNFKRLNVKETCRFSAVKIEKEKNKTINYVPTENKFTATLLNISGGGCCICSTLPIKEEQIIYTEFDLFDGTYYAIGKIVKTRKSTIEGSYNLHIKFINISIEVQNKILAKVYLYD